MTKMIVPDGFCGIFYLSVQVRRGKKPDAAQLTYLGVCHSVELCMPCSDSAKTEIQLWVISQTNITDSLCFQRSPWLWGSCKIQTHRRSLVNSPVRDTIQFIFVGLWSFSKACNLLRDQLKKNTPIKHKILHCCATVTVWWLSLGITEGSVSRLHVLIIYVDKYVSETLWQCHNHKRNRRHVSS